MQGFILAVLVISAQLWHMQRATWGFQYESVLTIFLPQQGSVPLPTLSALRQQWGQIPGVKQVTFGSDVPASAYNRPSPFSFHTTTQPEAFETRVRAIDAQYLSVFGIGLVAG